MYKGISRGINDNKGKEVFVMIINVANMFTGIFEALTIFMIYKAYLEKNTYIPNYIYFIEVIILSIMINMSNLIFDFGLFNALGRILSIYIISLTFKGKNSTRFIISVLCYLLLAAIEVTVLYSIVGFTQVSVSEAVNDENLRFLGIVISKLMTFVVFEIVCLFVRKNKIRENVTFWGIFLIMFLISTLNIVLVFNLQYKTNSTDFSQLSMICSIGLLYQIFFVIYLYEHQLKQSEQINKQKIVEQQMKEQTRHLDEILLTQRQFKILRHDLLNHLLSIGAYFNNGDCRGGIEYINSIKRIVINNFDDIDTGNISFDAIINAKKTLAESKGIKFLKNIQIPENLKLDAVDVSVIFGNLLDNAIEACDKINVQEKKITISVIYDDNSILCKISNTIMDKEKIHFKTTKVDKSSHGYGLESIKTTLEKYNHSFKMEQNNNILIVTFVILL